MPRRKGSAAVETSTPQSAEIPVTTLALRRAFDARTLRRAKPEAILVALDLVELLERGDAMPAEVEHQATLALRSIGALRDAAARSQE